MTDIQSNEDTSYWYLVIKRNTRNLYLKLTDTYILSDFPISDKN
jgi:hypothetical protein